MKVKDLIEKLKDCNPEALVLIFNPDFEEMSTVTGLIYGGPENTVELCSDDMQE